MAHIRTYQELLDLEPTKAEEELIEKCKLGALCSVGNGSLPAPDMRDPTIEIRAETLRYLVMGGCDNCCVDDIGVWLEGAYISGVLDLDYITARGAIRLINCRFENQVDMDQLRCKILSFSGCAMKGVIGQAVKIEGDVFLRKTLSHGPIDFNGARIGGQLSCSGANLVVESGFALNAHSAKIKGGIFLHPRRKKDQDELGQPFRTKGGINISDSVIGGLHALNVTIEAIEDDDALKATNLETRGDVTLDKANFTGEVKFKGATTLGDFSCKGAHFFRGNSESHRFNGQLMKVAQSFQWTKVRDGAGPVSLNGAFVAVLDDDPDNWPVENDCLMLDGFTYDRIRGKVSTSPERKQWLRNGSTYRDQFFPQPYTQYAKFLRDTGHDAQAREVLLERETLVRQYERTELPPLLATWRRFWDSMQRRVVGYGHRPFRSVGWLMLLIFVTYLPAQMAWNEGSFAPNSGPILTSTEWRLYHASEANPAQVWSGDAAPKGWEPPEGTTVEWKDEAPGRDWETFSAIAYGLDVVIPILNFGQTDAWAPSTTRGVFGGHLWWWRWVMGAFGWIVTALGAAAITGIIRRD